MASGGATAVARGGHMLLAAFGAALAWSAESAQATSEAEPAPTLVLPDIEVIGTAPLPGTGVPVDKVPSNIQRIGDAEIERIQPNNITDLLNQAVGSAAVVDIQNNPFQQNLQYRGFTASPLLGDPQGFAVYQNGVRINEPFGDVVQWDLIPEVAILDIDVVNSNPVFGLNALGGALTIAMQDGNSFQGAELSGWGGYFYRGNAQFQAGGVLDRGGGLFDSLSGYIAADYNTEDGWRNVSPSDLYRLYADVGADGEHGGVHLNLTYADTDLTGNGVAPTELLDVNRRAIFTSPDNTMNELFLGSVQGNALVSDTVSIQASAYYRRLVRTTLNGDEMDADECEFDTAAFEAEFDTAIAPHNPMGLAADDIMCAEEVEDDGVEAEAEVYLDQFGNVVPLFAPHNGALNTSSTQTTGYGFGLQGTIDDDLFGHGNYFVAGAGVDVGRTKFHTESAIGVLNLDRSVTAGPEPFEATALFEFETDGVDTEGEVERGEVGPARAVAENTYYGVYVSDTFDVTEALSVTLSGRYNYADIEITDELEAYFPRDITLDGDHSYSRFNPAAGATYTFPSIRTTLYGGYTEANRAPSPAELTCAEPTAPCRLPNAFVADPPLEQVVSRTFEAGVRGNLPDGWLGGATSLDWSLAFFHSELEDDIIFVSAGPALGTGFFQNIDETRRQGIEVGLGGRAGPARWFVNYSFIEATFESSFTVASPNHPLAVDGEIMVEPGDDIPGIPQQNFGLGVDVEVIDGLTVGGSLVAKSGVYLRGDEANLLETTDGYAVFNVRSGYRISDWLEVFGRIDNLFNTDYETFGVLGETGNEVPIYELPGGVTNPRFLSPGQPFAAFVGVRIWLN